MDSGRGRSASSLLDAPIPDPRSPIPDPRSADLRDWHWRGMFEPLPLPLDWPVYVSQAEASAYARWKGRRLMTEAEFHRAAEGSTTGHFDFAGFDPIPVGSHPPSAAGVYDLVGNGWEWTSTVFGPFDGFVPMRSYPEYSADFFDGRHYVMKGARRPPRASSCAPVSATGSEAIIPMSTRSSEQLVADFADRRPARSRAGAEAAAVEVSLRRAGLEPVRGDLPAAVVPHHPRRAGAAAAPRAGDRRAPVRRRGGSAADRRAGLRQRREDRDPRRSAAARRADTAACT